MVFKTKIFLSSRKLCSTSALGMIVIFLLLLNINCIAKDDGEPNYDEITVNVNVQGVGSIEIPAVIRNETVFLPITDIFNFLKIKNAASNNIDSISGFFINPDATFLFDRINNKIFYSKNIFEVKSGDFIKTESNLFLNASYFGKIFGLDCNFSFRSLSVIINTKLELPVIREMRQEMMRKNLNRLKGQVVSDTVIKPVHKIFNFGMADWSISNTQNLNGPNQTLLNLSLGSVVLGGETNVSLNYNSSQIFSEKQQFYQWRYADNENNILKQAIVGKIINQGISSIYAPIVGFQFTNAPTTYRRSFGTYTVSNTTLPGWIVELYINNVLVDYVKADASGFYSFQVPLVYGNSQIKFRFYGPWGEEKSKTENISIPFNFLPAKEIQYSITGGIVEDNNNTKFSRGIVSYGLNNAITIGAGFEYLSSIRTGTTMPFVTSSIRIGHNLLFSGDYTYGVRSKAILDYNLPSSLQVELNYTNYNKGQQAINNTYLEERKIVISSPFNKLNFSIFSRLTIDQFVLTNSSYTNAEWLISGSIFGIGTHLSTFGVFAPNLANYLYSNISMAFKLPKGLLFTPQLQYEYNTSRLFSMKYALEKHVTKSGYVAISYEQNFKSNLTSFALDMRYDFSFAQVGVSARQLNKTYSLLQLARGSLVFDPKNKYISSNNRTSVARGALVLIPFLDLNNNGEKDEDEPKILGLNIHINGGRVELSKKDSCIRVFDLEPFISYLLELDPNGFDNIGWQLNKKALSVFVDPNQFKEVDIPISVVAEVSGIISLNNEKGKKPQGQIIVDFYNEIGTMVGRTLSESDGFFDFIGLKPGIYKVCIDSIQLQKLKMIAIPKEKNITITRNKDGDVIDNIEFTIQKTNLIKDIHTDTQSNSIIPSNDKSDKYSGYAIQVASFKKQENAIKLQSNLMKTLRKPIYISFWNKYYKVRISGFETRKQVIIYKEKLKSRMYNGSIIVKIL